MCDKDRFPAFFEVYQEWRESTTFWTDFSIADRFGIKAVKDTFERAFKEWKSNARYLKEDDYDRFGESQEGVG